MYIFADESVYRSDSENVPVDTVFIMAEHLVPTIGSDGAKVFIVAVIAHDHDQELSCNDMLDADEVMVRRVLADNEEQAEELFLQDAKVQEYIREVHPENANITSIYDIDIWDALKCYCTQLVE